MNTMMKLSAVTALTASTLMSTQAFAATATGDASATIAQPISVAQTTPLNFGSVTTSAATGTIEITPAGAVNYLGGVANFGGTPTPATFAVNGEGALAFNVTLPTTATLTSGANSMVVNTFTHNAPAALTGGVANFQVGATLNVGANQPSGNYTGTYTITVNY